MKKRSQFVDDVGVRVGAMEYLVALDNFTEHHDVKKDYHANLFKETARMVGFTEKETDLLLGIYQGGGGITV